jgi:broad specificity phosphatase PhoE
MAFWLVRHGQTPWSLSGRHTGSTDVPLTEAGERRSQAIGEELAGHGFVHVLTSPMGRARRTAELAGFGERADVSEDLREYEYGDYEGLTTPQIWEFRPGWELFRDGCPNGESPEQMSDRMDVLLKDLNGRQGDVLLFGHGHCFRSLAVRYLGLPIGAATRLALDPGSVSVLSTGRDGPSLLLWNRVDALPGSPGQD